MHYTLALFWLPFVFSLDQYFAKKERQPKQDLNVKPLLACQCKATFSPNAFFHVHFKELSNDKTGICIESKNMNFVQGILATRPIFWLYVNKNYLKCYEIL